jgi:hypothetical protein
MRFVSAGPIDVQELSDALALAAYDAGLDEVEFTAALRRGLTS